MNEYELGTSVKLAVTFKDTSGNSYDPTSVTLVVEEPSGALTSVTSITNDAVGSYYAYFLTDEVGDHTYTFTGSTPAINAVDVQSGFFYIVDYTVTDLDFLIPVVRFNLGDYTAPYRYTTNILRQALVFGAKMLMRRWNSKYKVDSDGNVTRNANLDYFFTEDSPPVIMTRDEPAFVLQAAILIQSGSYQEASWQTAAWRDDEISVSNLEGQRSRDNALQRSIDLLEEFFKKRLYAGKRQALPGFKYPPNFREG